MMKTVPRAMRQSPQLRAISAIFLVSWCVIAAFPIFWIAVMSFKSPIDAFASNPLHVIFGPATRAAGQGLSILDIMVGLGVLWGFIHFAMRDLPRYARRWAPFGNRLLYWLAASLVFAVIFIAVFFGLLPPLLRIANGFSGPIGSPIIGFTVEHYQSIWIDSSFYRNFINSMMVTAGVVVISLTVGTLAGYGIARSGSNLAFWLLIMALIFRALPHAVLVAGYLPVFINSAELLRPILGDLSPTLYGKPVAVIAVMVAINQPFTIWMLRSFFQNIPRDLDEAARVDGCTHFQAFRWVIMPVMWPGVITAGLFSFLLAYNDFLVASLLLDAQNQTMVPAIAGFFNRETTTTDQVRAVAAAVSITAPLFLLIMVFQRQIVSGLTAGAVKG